MYLSSIYKLPGNSHICSAGQVLNRATYDWLNIQLYTTNIQNDYICKFEN